MRDFPLQRNSTDNPLKIAYIAAGAGGMYCGMCLHDNTLAAALAQQGEEILLIPTYTPLRTDEEDQSQPRIFFGGINVYLEQKISVFRHTPGWLTRVFDRRTVLGWVTKRFVVTDAAKLGDLTVSMLRGEEGYQRKELDELTDWLADEVQPDVVHLSNSMLIGMARQFRRRLGVPLVCSLSGEDIFLDRLVPPYYDEARALLRERSADVDRFVALNRYYADAMSAYMQVSRERIEVIPHGLKLAGHGTGKRPANAPAVTIGYLGRVCPDKGLHILAEAFTRLAQLDDLPPLELKVAGYLSRADRPYLRKIERQLARAGVGDRFEYVGEPDRAEKIAFLQSLDVMSLPTVYRESKGLSVLEAMANAVPVVLPDHGTFPELIEDASGGVLFEPENPDSLAEQLARLIRQPDLREQLGREGQASIHDRYHDGLMAERTRQLYRRLTRGPLSVDAVQSLATEKNE